MKKLLSLLATLFLGSFAFTGSFGQIAFASDSPPGINYEFEDEEDEGPPTLGGVEETTYTLTYTAGTGGKINGQATVTQTVIEGDDGTAVTAVPNTGYSFLKWSPDNKTTTSRTDTNINADATYTALFKANDDTPITYTLTYTAETGKGTITGSKTQTVQQTQDGTAVTAVSNTGYTFTKWSDGITSNPRQDKNVTKNISVTAQFTKNDDEATTYTLTYTAGTGGTLTGTTPQIVQSGKDGAYVTAKANTGYTFTKWSDGRTVNPRKDTNVKANLSVTAQFTKNTSNPNPNPDPDPEDPDLSKTGPETYVFLLLGLLLSLGVKRVRV